MKNQLKNIFGLLLIAVTLSPGCLVVSGGGHHDGDCYQDCHDYQVCETYCDYWSCWDECWVESSCTTVCEEQVDEPPVSKECYNDAECGSGQICVSDKCTARDTTDRGLAGLCQACETSNDCSEDGAKCIQLNFDNVSRTGEKVCTRVCNLDTDCPSSFECVKISDEANAAAQCLPKQGTNEKRTCNNGTDLECIKATDCALGESCVNNTCSKPEGVQCTRDGQCADGESCANGKCVAGSNGTCVNRSDCNSDELCINGACEKENSSCVFNSECNDGKCVNGSCQSTCNANSDCGTFEHCRQGLCEQTECRRAADCSAGQICVEAHCADSCSGNSDCGDGFVCSANGFCAKDPNVQCRTNAECGRDEVCNGGTCAAPCNCNQQCPTEQICNSDKGLCESPESPTPAPECANDCECPSGQSCTEGTCG